MSLRITGVGPHILLRNGLRANRTLIFCVMRLRLGITANTKRSVLSVHQINLINMGAGSDLVRLFIAEKPRSRCIHSSGPAAARIVGCRQSAMARLQGVQPVESTDPTARTESLTCAFVFEADAAPPSVIGYSCRPDSPFRPGHGRTRSSTAVSGPRLLPTAPTARKEVGSSAAEAPPPHQHPSPGHPGRRRRRRAHPTSTPVPAAPAVLNGQPAAATSRRTS